MQTGTPPSEVAHDDTAFLAIVPVLIHAESHYRIPTTIEPQARDEVVPNGSLLRGAESIATSMRAESYQGEALGAVSLGPFYGLSEGLNPPADVLDVQPQVIQLGRVRQWRR